jgi:peptide methionine sulfoxide reductase MsrA
VEEVNKKLAEGTFRPVAGNRVVTTIEPAADYFIAEDYHQQVRKSLVGA